MTPYPKARQARRPRKNETGEFSKGTAQIIVDRDVGRCAWCGGPLPQDRGPEPWQYQIQHRLPRASGGTTEPFVARASNGVAVHARCHQVIEVEDRAEAEALGFVIKHGLRRPTEIPIKHAVHGLVLLDDEGTWKRVAA